MALNSEILLAVKNLADLIKADKSFTTMMAAAEVYEKNEKIATALTEYTIQQTALTEEYAKDETDRDTALIDSVQNRINELYRMIINDPDYEAYKTASDEYETFFNSIMAEMQYMITGKSACSGDCSSCGGCH